MEYINLKALWFLFSFQSNLWSIANTKHIHLEISIVLLPTYSLSVLYLVLKSYNFLNLPSWNLQKPCILYHSSDSFQPVLRNMFSSFIIFQYI